MPGPARILLAAIAACVALASPLSSRSGNNCTVKPLGPGQDDAPQILKAMGDCNNGGTVVLGAAGDVFNISQRMTWNLQDVGIEWNGVLKSNTYQTEIQSQATSLIISGHNIHIDAHQTGGVDGSGQVFWSYYFNPANNITKNDGDGRPIAFTIQHASNVVVKDFHIWEPILWSSLIDASYNVTLDGMVINATNTDPLGAGKNWTPNTDGFNTFRSDTISFKNWKVICGDDCGAIKGNSTNIYVKDFACFGGNGFAFGSLGQYQDQEDIVENVYIENLAVSRIDSRVQPNMGNGIYMKTWVGVKNGEPPISGGGGTGRVHNVTVNNLFVGNATYAFQLYQTSGSAGATSGLPGAGMDKNTSTLQFSDITFNNVFGLTTQPKAISVACSPAAPCHGVRPGS
ncbi:hypothetical protein QFC21_003240 [Naganishia friedmannii]|uniref:Uncharacterized protein n=1 Tax=Naganishia friedmannii TaxID=89922 RepID=A0ACC2VS78_9TREE|nr:hypothetical protein QFC21_003240 [Naganishia friedmannii]